MIIFFAFLTLVIIQRLAELGHAKSNEKKMRALGAIEYDSAGYKYIVVMHTGFFISLIAEYLILNRDLNQYWKVFFIIFVLAQILRYWSIYSLGMFWNTKILILKGSKPIKSGPYRYFRHPNYAAVAIELLVIPLLFSCYITVIVFSILNAVILIRRIKIEQLSIKYQ